MAAVAMPVYCPRCGKQAQRRFTVPTVKAVEHQRLRYGSGSPGKVILGKETGGLDIFIPSDGLLEQEEVDYIALGAVEKEQERVRNAKRQGFQRENQARIAAYSQLARSTKKGQRAKTVRQAAIDTGDVARNNLGRRIT